MWEGGGEGKGVQRRGGNGWRDPVYSEWGWVSECERGRMKQPHTWLFQHIDTHETVYIAPSCPSTPCSCPRCLLCPLPPLLPLVLLRRRRCCCSLCTLSSGPPLVPASCPPPVYRLTFIAFVGIVCYWYYCCYEGCCYCCCFYCYLFICYRYCYFLLLIK